MVYALHCSIPFTYQFHLVGTESWRQNVPPLLPNFILSEKEKLIDLSINLGCENASLALYIIEKRGYASAMPPRGHRVQW